MEAFEEVMRRGGSAAMAIASRFFTRDDPVHQSLRRIARRLSERNVSYAVLGGMALVAHGYNRTTEDVDVLVTAEGLVRVRASLEAHEFLVDKRNNSLRDVETGVRIDFRVSGRYPGDGRPKPVAFPDPGDVGVEINGIWYVSLPVLVELKLASGMSSAGRLKDLGDAQELIKVLKLPVEFAEQLNEYVRGKYVELWRGVAEAGEENG
jgi:hypothetical protein